MKLVLLLALSLLPLGCERAAAERPASSPAANVAAARVNGVEISLSVPKGGKTQAIQALEKAIDRELLVQQALKDELERDPAVAAQLAEAIENARREVLARAWLERRAGAARSNAEKVRDFYNHNPALFAERRIYRLNELAVSAPSEMVEVLRGEIEGVADLDAAAARLRARSLRFTAGSLTAPAEKLPLAYLPRLARMKAGEVAVFPAPSGATVVQVAQVEEAPLSEEQAAPLIEQFLAGRKRLELAAAEVRRLRQTAAIEYVGEFKRN